MMVNNRNNNTYNFCILVTVAAYMNTAQDSSLYIISKNMIIVSVTQKCLFIQNYNRMFYFKIGFHFFVVNFKSL
jgi:hypothetical protein